MENTTVLIIEDEKAIAMAMKIKLQKANIEVQAVFSGDEGIKEIDSNAYSLVLLDIMMPGIDGWEVLSHIVARGTKTKVIVTSNLSQEEDKKKAIEMGAVDFLVKSEASLSSIVEVVKSHLAE
jgi:two-component system, OmpR family, copper resistance phosphate regulon response regulator CusR